MSKTLTLEEAAQQLGLTPEQFKTHLKTHKDFRSVRPLMGGATMHFRAQDIDELGRRLGLGSDSELQLGDGGSDPVIPLSTDDDDSIEIGRDVVRGSGASSVRLSGKSGKHGKPAGDDALVLDSSDEFIPLADGGSGRKTDSKARVSRQSDSDAKVQGKSGVRRPAPTAPTDQEIELDSGHKPGSSKKMRKPGGKTDDVFSLAPEEGGSKKPKSGPKSGPKKPADGSEFELKLEPDSDSEFELTIADEGSDEVDLGKMPKDATSKGGKSGVRLSNPADSGISLEKDSDSEFELNLDSRSSQRISGPKSSGKNKAKQPAADSDSEFELTLDDSSGSIGEVDLTDGGHKEKDIFETDFDIPALDDDSASEAVVLEEGDTDLESSDFDLALDESGIIEDSASEVVELEEDLDAAPKSRRSGRRRGDESASEALADIDEEEEEEERAVVAGPQRPARWGPLPALILMPCMLIMFFVVVMGYELLHGMWGFRQPTKATSPVTRIFASMFVNENEMPKEP